MMGVLYVFGSHTWGVMLQEPERAAEGLGGTYFFKDDLGNKVAIVKPCDEEPLAPNNPKVLVCCSCHCHCCCGLVQAYDLQASCL